MSEEKFSLTGSRAILIRTPYIKKEYYGLLTLLNPIQMIFISQKYWLFLNHFLVFSIFGFYAMALEDKKRLLKNILE